jgi:hypothetical protein
MENVVCLADYRHCGALMRNLLVSSNKTEEAPPQ